MAGREVIVILGNQLVPDHPALRKHPEAVVVMIEADDNCRRYRYHKHKLMLVLGSMRSYADRLDRTVDYVPLEPGSRFRETLGDRLKHHRATKLIWMHASDKGPNRMLTKLADEQGCETAVYTNKQFLTTTKQFGGWLDSQKSKTPLMETFYRWQRKRLGLLMDGAKPAGGKWNYDHENRHPLPKESPDIPALPTIRPTKHTKKVVRLVNEIYADNPGDTEDFWLPTTRQGALEWLDAFITERLGSFGTYEDAMKQGEPFLYHSVLTPLLNVGLLIPDECVRAAIDAYDDGKAPLNSVEGFVRQVIGWREFMYGLYWWKQDDFDANFFGFSKQLEDWWYDTSFRDQDLPLPLSDSLERLHRYGYNHHIERLMVLGNWFLLSGYDPRSVYDWFSGMYVDAYEWVMVPNVLGMSQYADGGMLATKPYVSGGNYLQKMGRWWDAAADAKDSEYTRKYWQFLYDNRLKFSNNHRMSLALSQAANIAQNKST